jgi:YggT family protein
MLVQIAQFFLDTLLEPYAALLLLRFHLQWLRAPLRNPLGEFVILLTDPLVSRARRLIPSIKLLDTATLLLALVMEMVYLSAVLLLHNYPLSSLTLLAWALIKLIKISIYLLMGALFLEALLSWTNPHAPFAPVLRSITYPFLRPLHRFVPPKGGLDFSFLILFFLCYIILALPLGWLEGLVLKSIFLAAS